MSEVAIARSVVRAVRQTASRSRTVRRAVRQAAVKNRSVLRRVAAPVGIAVGLSRPVVRQVRDAVGLARPVVSGVRAPTRVAAPYLDSVRPFLRVAVDFLTTGNSLVSWELSPRFFGAPPYTFQLQVGETDSPAADDWVDVGDPVVDAFFAVDELVRRWRGKARLTGYRVVLTTGDGSRYYSPPAATTGNLNWRDWRIAQEVVRKERLRHAWQTSVEGVLFKRKRAGVPCTRCLDGGVGAATDSACPVCYGTTWVGGYYPPLVAAYADVSLERTQEQRSPQGLGMEQPVDIAARFVGWPFPAAKDVWAAGTRPSAFPTGSDLRYVVDGIKVAAHLRGVPLVLDVTLKKLPPEDVVYTLAKAPA